MDHEFSNRQIDAANLPSIEDVRFSGLHKDYLTAGLISTVLFWLVISATAVIIILTREEGFPVWAKTLALIVLGLLMLFAFTVQVLGFKKKQYAVREKDILYKNGLIWRSAVIVPFNRIQHAEVHQGPIDRLFDLSYLKVYTAGGSSSDLSIPGLRPSTANKIKHYILTKTSLDEEE